MDEWMAEQNLEESDRVAIEKELRLLWLLWAACLSVVPIVLIMSLTVAGPIREDMQAGSGGPLGVITVGLSALAVFSVGLSYFLRRWFLAGRFKWIERQAVQAAAQRNRPVYLTKYFSAVYLPMAVAATPAICGFFLFVHGADTVIFYVLLVVAAFGLLYHRPKRHEILELLQKEKANEQSS